MAEVTAADRCESHDGVLVWCNECIKVDHAAWRQSEAALKARVTALENLVRRMRDAQRRYFITRDQSVLVESKMLEREVDRALAPGAGGPA